MAKQKTAEEQTGFIEWIVEGFIKFSSDKIWLFGTLIFIIFLLNENPSKYERVIGIIGLFLGVTLSPKGNPLFPFKVIS